MLRIRKEEVGDNNRDLYVKLGPGPLRPPETRRKVFVGRYQLQKDLSSATIKHALNVKGIL